MTVKNYQIDYLKNHPQFIDAAVDYLYDEFIDKSKISHEEMKGIVESRCNVDKLPITLVAFIQNRFLGTVPLFKQDLEGYKQFTPWLAAFFVVEEYRKQSIGKSLVREIITLSKKLRFKNLYLRTEKNVEYYEKLGWHLLKKENGKLKTNIMIFK